MINAHHPCRLGPTISRVGDGATFLRVHVAGNNRYRRVRRRYFSVIEAEKREVERMRAELGTQPSALPIP